MFLRKGIALPFEKKTAMLLPTTELTDVPQIVLPYAYPTDAPIRSRVSLYDTVRQGTALSDVEGEPFSVVHSSVTGMISGERDLFHPVYGDLHCAIIDCLPESESPTVAPENGVITTESVLEAAELAGVIDELDGIPLMLKLREWHEQGSDFVVADAVEVQPYCSAGWATLRSDAEQVLDGLSLIAGCVGASHYHIAACLSVTRRRSIALRVGKDHFYQAESIYPAREPVRRGRRNDVHTVKRGGIVRRVGVQACLALSRAVRLGEAHSHTIVTVSGDAIKNPQNMLVPFGTPVQELLRRCGLTTDPTYLILGDSMTGVASLTQDIPVLAGMTCVLAFTAEKAAPQPSRACIGCGRCATVCPAGLLPFEIHRRYQNMQYERLASLHPSDCRGCGSCSYVCPCALELSAAVQEAAHTGAPLLLDLKEDTDA